LITETEADYEDLILALASHPERLAAVKAKLAKNRMTTPLFDTKRYAKNFEIGMRRAYDLYLDGKEPEDIWTAEPD
jgi:predicted O-linked N-acetylglucosamine transferase (SPINDLY family)